MRRRTRFAAGLLVLVALAFSLVEGVWASTCAPGMEMDGAGMTMDASAAETHDGMPVGGQEQLPAQGDSDCPIGRALLTQGCALAASLPAPATVIDPPSLQVDPNPPASDEGPRLIYAASVFHPPRL